MGGSRRAINVIATCAALALLTISCGSPKPLGQSPSSPSVTSEDQLGPLDCVEGELVADLTYEVGEDPSGGPQGPRAALARLFRTEPVLAGHETSKWARTAQHPPNSEQPVRVEMKLEREGKTLAEVTIEDIGQDWFVTHAMFCGSET